MQKNAHIMININLRMHTSIHSQTWNWMISIHIHKHESDSKAIKSLGNELETYRKNLGGWGVGGGGSGRLKKYWQKVIHIYELC